MSAESSALLPRGQSSRSWQPVGLAYIYDLAILSTGVCFTFTAYNGTQQIITTLLPTIGSLSLGICYSAFAIACVVAPAITRTLGLKTSIAIQLFVLSGWIASNLRPSIEIAIPVALVMGFGAASFWTAVPTYIATICHLYDQEKNIPLESRTKVKSKPPERILQRTTSSDTTQSAFTERLILTLRLAFTDMRLMLMIPLFLYQGLEQAFIFSVFGSRLVAPVFGDGMVGTISVGFGVTNVVASLLLGKLTDTCGWPLPLAVGLVAQVGALIVLLGWQYFDIIVVEKDTYGVILMYTIAGAWGLGDAAFNSVVSAMLGVFFPPNTNNANAEAAFANMRLWASLVTGICFFGMPPLHQHTSSQTSIMIELVVPFVMALIASVSLVILRNRYRSESPRSTSENPIGGSTSLGIFQGVFFSSFMTTHVSGNALSGSILGSTSMHPTHDKIAELFEIYCVLGVIGLSIITFFLRSHSTVVRATNPTVPRALSVN